MKHNMDVGLVVGGFLALSSWAIGIMTPEEALTVGCVVYVVLVMLDMAVDEIVEREIEERGLGDDDD